MKPFPLAVALAAAVGFAAPAFADDSSRAIQSSVDAYLGNASADARLVGGPGSAGYDGGFWIRGGSFLMKTNLTIQTRWEGFDWDDQGAEPNPGGDLSGFSLPRLTLKLSGDATCDMHYYAELEFGHAGTLCDNFNNAEISAQVLLGYARCFGQPTATLPTGIVPFNGQDDFGGGDDYGIAREAWIEYEACPALAVRMGLLKTATTRQLMTPPEMQQFVDVSMASAAVGLSMPGYSDRNRDYGLMVHGVLGCDGEWSYLATVTNGDGPVHRNVLDGFTSDNLAVSARVNWDVKGHMGYEEGALRQRSCEWTAAVGAWAHYYADHFAENPISKVANKLTWGVDAAVGYGGWSFTGAYNSATWDESDFGADFDGMSWFAQVGYLFPDTAWEVAARYGVYEYDFDGGFLGGASEYAFAVNYYVDGHSNKLTADVSFVAAEDDGNPLADVYAGYSVTIDSDATLLRFQWQLAL
jgi:hypothetical protein